MKNVRFDARGENDVRLVVGDDTVRIPRELITAASALAVLIGTKGSGIGELVEFIFHAGKEAGKDDLCHELRPLVNSMDAAARGAVETLGGILEQLPKEG